MNTVERIQHIRAAFPQQGMFRDKEWMLSDRPFSLPSDIVTLIQQLGPALRAFQRASNELYFLSAAGTSYPWVAEWLDRGKPQRVIDLGRDPRWRDALPRVIRPDLVFTEDGVCITELDSIPGGIGLTAWLNQTYAALGDRVIGGTDGMLRGVRNAFPGEDILISRESADYQPEMEWIAQQLNDGRSVMNPWNLDSRSLPGRSLYRFFELFDLPNIENIEPLLELAQAGEITFSPPLKAFLEEKLWLVLFWNPQLADYWKEALSTEHWGLLRRTIPQGWFVDPTPLPSCAVLPGLNVHDWEEVKRFGGKDRQLVLKISGFSEIGWGARSVSIGHDLSQEQWRAALDEALASAADHPYVLQVFHRARVVDHPAWNEELGGVVNMRARVRLCPYFFAPDASPSPELGGILATVCPADKKILHGMKDAIMLPCTQDVLANRAHV